MKTITELINKYNSSAPRYTSYPPVPFWKEAPQEDEWFSHIKKNYLGGVDLYVHIPFCEKLCWYCGCNRIITKDHGLEDQIIESILLEWSLYQKKIPHLKINSLHLGGGTPTFLSPRNLDKLITELTKNRSENFIGSIEIDPRTTTEAHLFVLKKLKFERISLGIQDFDEKVQQSINRYQPVSLVKALISKLRKLHFESINFDLIYGLPNQTVESIKKTIEIVTQLSPDLISFYGYAHLPDKIANQKLIKSSELPCSFKRQEIYEEGKKLLIQNGLYDIGLDHFAEKSNYLYKAKEKGHLHRNFMGYTDKKSNCLIGLGPSAISDSSLSFIQNIKNLEAYQEALSKGNLPYSLGHTLSSADHVARKYILEIMCQEKTTLGQDLVHYELIQKDLLEFSQDEIIRLENNSLVLTQRGKLFMRNVAASFDHHLRERKNHALFSQSV